jgi:Kef-type K+ transport system membrane component KefB
MQTGHTLLLLIAIIAAAKVGGELAERLGQPAVLGELLVGVLLGLTPLRAAAADPAIAFVAAIGIILLLFEAGLGSELDEFARVGVSATLVAIIGVVLPLVAGFGVAYALGHSFDQALFLGALLTATSVGITARVLSDAGALQSREAKIILGAAVIDDILGLLMLSLVLQLTVRGGSHPGSLALTAALALSFLVVAVWAGIRLAPRLIPLTQQLRTRGVLVSMAFLFCIAMAVASKALGMAEIIGAFAAGLVLASTDDRVDIERQIRPVTDIFIPVFFVMVGLHLNVADLNPLDPAHRATALLGGVLLVLAVAGKLASGLGVRAPGVSRLAVGVGMVPRGEVGLIFASVGLSEGVLPPALYAQMVMIVFVSTLMVPTWLRHALRPRQSGRG